MTTTPRTLQTAITCTLAALTFLVPTSASAIEGGAKSTLVDRRTENRMEVVVAAGEGTSEQIALGERIGRDLMAYRFRLEAVDAAGTIREIPTSVALTIRIGAFGTSQMHLSTQMRDVTLPRPFGIRLGADDSLVVVLTQSQIEGEEFSLRVSIDYEPVDRVQSRLSVTSVRTDSRPAATGRTGSWEWTQAVDGRVLAIAGLPLSNVAEVILIEVETGATLWTASPSGFAVSAATPAGAVLRMGVSLKADRTYRLTVTFSETALEGAATQSVLAIVLPSSR